MTLNELLQTLSANNVQLVLKDGQLVVQGNRQALSDAALVARLREHKAALVAMIERGEYVAARQGSVEVPANLIPPGCRHITAQMLNLVDIDQDSLDRLVAGIPGGAANIQDIYPLAPLQQGLLFHHESAGEQDPYVLQLGFVFADESRLQALADALGGVIARHDILRTSVHWKGLETPLQVVWRRAELPVLDLPADDPRRGHFDLTRAPLIRLLRDAPQADGRPRATLQFHHIALDHSALEVVQHELVGFLTGTAGGLGTPVPFRNYVAQAVLGVGEAEHEAFFRDMLGEIDEPTLAYALRDVPDADEGLDEYSLDLPATLCQRLRALARQHGVSLASLFHLAWGRVLGGLTGRDRVVFGTVLMGRLLGAEATDRALGIFINTLPLRVDLDATDWASALKATHQRLSTLMRHEHAPLARAQRCSQVAGTLPLFNTLLNYRHSAPAASQPPRAELGGIEALQSSERSTYALTLSVDDLGQGLRLTLLAAARVPAQRVCAYLQQTLESLLEAPGTAVNRLEMLPAGERHELLETFNHHPGAPRQPEPLQRRIEAHARQYPDDIAATHAGKALTYAGLNARANALAHHLAGLGVRPEDRVAVIARRGLDTLAGLLAVLKAGAGYVPVDPAHPDERIRYLLDDSAPTVVLTQHALQARLAFVQAPQVLLDRPDWPARDDDPVLPGIDANNLAYVIYTSGSTGQPKGVMVEHRTLDNLVDWHCRAFDLCRGRQTSSLAGFGFDAMAWEIWPALCAGATLHLAPCAEGPDDLDALLHWWRDQALDVSFLPTPVAEYAFSQQIEHPTLRTLLIGGDRLRQFNRNQRFAVVNNYGPTETTVVASSGVVEAGAVLHIGRPVDNARLYVLDARRQPVPLGVPGELYIGGAGVARGYLGRPQLSAECFLHDPFDSTPGQRMYRTGDRVRWLADGTLEFLGRNDDQVKIRGVRIEPGEIESRLASLPGINEAVVLAREDQPGQPRLVAYFTRQAAVEPLDPQGLRAQLQAHLPEYMVPVAFVELAALPLTANGKLDRRALPLPERSALVEESYQAPEGELENTLAQVWAQLLQVERVGRHDGFFSLGGHSLLAMRMVSQVRQQLGVELPLATLFASDELAAVAAQLASAARSELPPLLALLRETPQPLSFAQQRLWFLAQMAGGNQAYNVPLALGLRGPLDSDALERAVGRIVERHDTLRSQFVAHGDTAEVRIAASPVAGWFRQETVSAEALAERLQAEAGRAFDLGRDPLLRVCLLRLDAEHHVLVLNLHHIVADGWSLGVLTRELSALYPALRDGHADPLPPLALQYGDYAAWQQRWLTGEQLQRQADFWRQALDGAPALLKLPADRPRPERQDFAGASLALQLDERLGAGLRALAQRHGVTLYMVLLGAWAALLNRLSGQDDVVIGCPVAGRVRAELEPLVGLFVNTLAVRIDSAGACTAEGLLQQVRQRLLDAQAHQDLPFEQVVEIVRPARSLSHTPLFQTTLNWQASGGAVLELDGLQLEAVALGGQTAKFDLSLTLAEHGDALVGVLEYATALFDAATVQRYAGYLEALLRAMVDNDQAPLEQVDLLGAEERQHLVQAFNPVQQEPVPAQTVHALIEARAGQMPLALAVRAGERSLNYGQLNAQANALAHHLIALGVQPDERVAVVARRGLDTLVGLLAVLKAGAAYVPMDPAQPDERLRYLIEDSAPRVLLTQGALRERLGAVDIPVLLLDRPDWPARRDNPRLAALTPRNLAYVIYTSGSTGLPKGVMVEHQALVNLVHWHCRAFDLQAGDHSASLAGFGFDAMAWEVWPALCAGAVLHLPAAELGNEQLDALLDWWCAQPLKVAFLPTPMAEYLFARGRHHPTLRTLLIGGDRLRQFSRDPGYAVINNYGPTETTVVATSGRVLPGGALDIGKPVDGARVYLLDEQRQLVPFGCTGELYIGGAGVARGYLGRAELSTERFLDDPFSELPGARMYRSGDLARWQADGTLAYLGRNDDQVKIRGMRIELGEIEMQLAQLDGVEEALVLVREERLVAYFTGQSLPPADLRLALQQRLPGYMVPAAFVHLAAWPLTANGKVDRRALPQPSRDALAGSLYEAPLGALEVTLAQVWQELLQVEQVGRQDRFFDLGGHSLLAMRMLAQVRQRLGLELALGELFVDDRLMAVAASLADSESALLPPIGIAPRGDSMPLSFAQQRLWFLAQLEPSSAAYHIPLVLQLDGALDRAALERALRQLVERHESLRSRFVEQDGQPCVRLADADAFALDWGACPEDGVQALVEAHAQRPFALDRDLPVRAAVLHLAPQRHVLLLTLHHIVADGWSMGVLLRELDQLYQGAGPLPALPVQYLDYAVWQRDWLSGEAWQRQADHWRQALDGAPALISLPTDRPRPERQDYRGDSVGISVDPHLGRRLKAVCSRHGVTPYMLFMSAWAVLLARLSGQHEVVIGSPLANRRLAELDGLIGMFVNSIALRIDTSGAPDLASLLARVKGAVLAAQAHQDLPFEQVVELVRPERSLAHTPLYQVSLDWQGSPDAQALRLGGLDVTVVGGQPCIAKFDLSLSMAEQGDGFSGALLYATALFERGTIERYAGYLEQLLLAFVADDAVVPGQVGLLGGGERERLLLAFNDTAREYDLDQTLHGLIEAQVGRTPDAVAVRAEAGELSYRQLNEQANRLAHYLIGLGVKPDDRVAICVERGLSTVVGLLAILKAGGAYVPVDPDYPAERVRHMLDDSQPVAVLVHAATRHVAVDAIDLDHPSWEDKSTTNPQVAGLTPRHLAYVIYTSGSTGLPKGVMNEHVGVVNRLLWMQDAYGLGADDVVLQKTPFSFDVSVWEFLWPLQTGARLVMARPGGHRDPEYLREVIRREQVTTLHFVPSMLDVFLAHGQSPAERMKRVLCSGEALPGSLVRRFHEQFPTVELHNLYGPTEAAVDVSAWYCITAPDNTPIGKPIANTTLYVLDEQRQPVPQGVAGELYIGGVQVARGYLNRPELTAERFIDDPFSSGRLYRTGDLARHLADGNLEYLGRNDDQVKIRGLRIELGEIQSGLTHVPGIKEAVVIARDQRLIAYYTGDQQPTETLRSALLSHLPEFMVPALFMHLSALPLSPNGKLDRKALPDAVVEERLYEAPEGETETLLADLWSELLNVDRVGRHDNFFELGGHSLLAVSLIARLRAVDVHMDVQALFTQPTLAALAGTLGQHQRLQVPANRIEAYCQRITPDLLPLATLTQDAIDRIVASVPGGATNVQDIYPLGPLQSGILYHHLASEGEDAYVLRAHFAVADHGRLEALRQALDRVIERHDSLRTALCWEGLAQPLQVVWRQARLPVEAATATSVQRLDLTRAPLLRLVYEEQPDSGTLSATLLFHHGVMDHISLEVLGTELQAILLDEAQDLPAPVPYRNYIAQVLQGTDEQAQEAFFREQLGEIDEPTLPYGQHPAPHLDARPEASQWLDAEIARQVRARARQFGVSAASLMHLAWGMVLGQLTGRDRVVFGTVLLGRLQGSEGVERALGVFINTLPLRIDLGSLPVREALLDANRRLVGLLAHEHAQLALAQRCSALPAGAPLFSALLNYRHGASAGVADEHARQAAWHGIELLRSEERSNYPMTLSIDDLGEGFVLTARCAAGIDARRLCAYLQQAVSSLVTALAQAPEQGLERLSVVPREEREQTVLGFNARHQDYPRERTLAYLFEQRVTQHPAALAVVDGEQQLTYGELNAQANRLAHRLLDEGVRPGEPVATLLPRSVELLVAQLAILKCAAVYVPLDVQAPPERQVFMLEDCQAVRLLTTRQFPVAHGTPRIDLDNLTPDAGPAHNPDHPQDAEAVACLIYTSGSTGTPKGVRVAHRGIVRLVLDDGYADFNPQDRVALAANPAFDASNLEVWGALLNGARLQVIDHSTLIDPQRFATALREQHTTVLFLTTALFNQYVQLIPEALAGLRVLMCGGERSDPAAFRTMLAQGSTVRLIHAYGPTETSTFATTCEVRAVAAEDTSVPIGRPIGSTQVYILDAHRRPVPLGVVGELCIGGDGVARGYHQRPQLSAERFIDDLFSPHPGAQLYCSGDLARWREDGQLDYLGRNDDQVKIRGYRIEPGEIQQQLAQCPGIGEALVMAVPQDAGPLRLVAWFTRQDPALDAATLRGYLQTRLPAYMLPAAYVGLEALPLTRNGKVDRAALPLPQGEDLPVAVYQAPATELEQRLAECWARVLGVERVGRHDSFFELGGHSLLAIGLVTEMAKVDVQTSLAELFQHPSVAQLAAQVQTRSAPPGQQGLVTVRAGGSLPPLFLVHEFSGLDLYFPALGRHVEGDFPIYGLPGIPAGEAQLRTLEGLATRLVEQIRRVQPHGPYRLAGWSFGGVLAYEIAAQLLGADEPVAFVGLLDTYVPRLTDQGKARWQGPHLLERHLLAYARDYWQAQGESAAGQLARIERLRPQAQDFETLLGYFREHQLLPDLARSSDPQLRHYFERELAHGHAMAHYRVAPLGMPVHLFRAEQPNPRLVHAGPALGWDEVLPASQLQCISVPGDHMSMLQAPRVEVLGRAISVALQGAVAHEPAPLSGPVAIQSGQGSQAPLFCVPGAGDSITSFIGLAEALGADWPLHGLQSRGLDGAAVPHSSVEAAADGHVRAIQALYPQGPLNLVGHSFGGWVAHAMAARFEAMGRPVHSLTLIDSEAPGEGSTCGQPHTLTEALERLIESLQLSTGKALGIEPLAFAEADDGEQLRQLHGAMVRVGLLPARSTAGILEGSVRTFATALRTVYRPALPYSGPVGLVLVDDPRLDAAGNAREHAAMQAGWQRLMPQLATWQGPGNHFSILKVPDVFSLAAWWHDRQAFALKRSLNT
ncbi:MAG: amino acid adenylation domain-containing protein [Pseudomonas putida]|nr:amino acid adenylation domain-containing protein [Pseudomonas putida]